MRLDSAGLLGPAQIPLAHWIHASPKKQLKERGFLLLEIRRPVSAFPPVSQGSSIEHPLTVRGPVCARSYTLYMHLPEGITTKRAYQGQ